MSDLIDVAVLNQLKEFIQDKLGGVVEVFVKNSDDYVQAIQDGLENGDAQAVVDSAHPLKSSSANLGLVALSKLCAELEEEANAVLSGDETIENLASKGAGLASIYEPSVALLKAQV